MAESTAVIVETATTEVGVIVTNTTVVGTVSAAVQVAGGVSSVNAETGVVVLTASDVGADPAGTAASAVAAEAVLRSAADLALDTRVDALEAVDPLTQTEGDARYWPLSTDLATQVELNAEATTRGNADTALDGRLDTLEAVTPLLSVVAGDNVTIDDTDPQNPIISAEAGGGGSGVVETVVAGSNIDVDSTDPANPVVSLETLEDADIPASIARDSEVTAAVAAEAALARNGDNITSGTVADARIASTIARDSEVAAGYQPLDADLTALAAAGNSAVLAATTASFLTADETKLDGVEALADVTDAANVAAAGAVMEADTSTAPMGFVVDEDDMASNSATKVPTQQSVKAYVDASTGSGFLKDYDRVQRTAGSVTLNQSAVTAVDTGLDLVLTAAAGDLIIFGISALASNVAQVVCFDVYTMVAGVPVNPFGVGIANVLADSKVGIPALRCRNVAEDIELGASYPRTLVGGDVTGGTVTLRLFYAKLNTTARTLYATTTIPLDVWAVNLGAV